MHNNMSKIADINKLVSLTFDEDPDVRKKAAVSLGEMDDPAAVFALVELSYDKEPSVRDVAQKTLEGKKKAEPELMSFAEIFSRHEEKKDEVHITQSKERVLGPITQLFERRLGKERGEVVKKKMMPTIEKIYMKAVSKEQTKEKQDESGRKAMQEFLTSYLEAISDIERIGDESTHQPLPSQTVVDTTPEIKIEEISSEIGEVGKQHTQLDNLSSEIAGIELERVEELKEKNEIGALPDTFFKKAYEVMMLSEGDSATMKTEMDRMIQDAKREITLAFKLAKKKFKETKITNITKIRDGMRNINTDILQVESVENMEYQKTKKTKSMLARLVLHDETGNEGLLYLFDGRGTAIKPGMNIKVKGSMAKTFKFSGETALMLSEKGNVYIVL